MFLPSVSSGIRLVLSFSPVVTSGESIGQAVIIDCLCGFSSVHSTVNMHFLIFPRVEENTVYLLEVVIFFPHLIFFLPFPIQQLLPVPTVFPRGFSVLKLSFLLTVCSTALNSSFIIN